ncbi:hypothetical protein Ae201684P_011219 [Aphanomyces euteiches]|uniref:Autophagy protein ATG17-like domain-containing protein n=1 Tax=Aphanomyces euteiches TaxID=100861 RepID=A0A6G0XWV0_9STRA|nr:hypothetical protein Ae201684_000591 [Aphanomyces euteiches]KAH9091675.1 hypothetical protein Ae201684P_011219 [Aphanomyces euteiches]KAH9152801.1 hypothetical protein AeRB84_004828 [Aphanomyces euteiches]
MEDTSAVRVSLSEVQLKIDGTTLAEHYEKAIAMRLLLQDISATMSLRVQAVETSLDASEAAYSTQLAAVEELVQTHKRMVAALDSMFAELKQRMVDPTMVGGEVGKTLFDFVDAETVVGLEHEANALVQTIRDQLKTNEESLQLLHATLSFYRGLDFNGLLSLPADTRGDIWDALAATCQERQQQALDCKTRQAALLETTLAKPDRPAALVHAASESSALAQAGLGAVTHLNSLYDIALEYFVDMEQCDRRILATFTKMHEASQAYDSAFIECQSIVEELSNLLRFYERFIHAYETLPNEIQRRRDYDAATDRLVEDMQRKLAERQEEEVRRREVYANDYLHFLPGSLCPSIKELPRTFRIVTDQPASTPQ